MKDFLQLVKGDNSYNHTTLIPNYGKLGKQMHVNGN